MGDLEGRTAGLLGSRGDAWASTGKRPHSKHLPAIVGNCGTVTDGDES